MTHVYHHFHVHVHAMCMRKVRRFFECAFTSHICGARARRILCGEIQRAWTGVQAGALPSHAVWRSMRGRLAARRCVVGAPPGRWRLRQRLKQRMSRQGRRLSEGRSRRGGRQANPHAGPLASMLRGEDKIRLLGFTTLHDSRRYTILRCLGPLTPRLKGTVNWR